MNRATAYSACIAEIVQGTPRRGVIHSAFSAAANVVFAGGFVLSLNAATSACMPNGLQLSSEPGTVPFAALRPGMSVLLGADRLLIDAIDCSLDLAYCTQWNPQIECPESLDRDVVSKNMRWLRGYVGKGKFQPSYLTECNKSQHSSKKEGQANGRPSTPTTGDHKGPPTSTSPPPPLLYDEIRGLPRIVGAGVGMWSYTGRLCRAKERSGRGVGTGGCGDEDAGAWCLSCLGLGMFPPGEDEDKHQAPASSSASSPYPYASPQKPPCVSPGGRPSENPHIFRARELARTLCGRGPGLTPGGDDMLAGWMALHWLLYGPTPAVIEACQEVMLVARQQTHLLSQCWLGYAAKGKVALPVRRLLYALTLDNERELTLATEEVLSLGATSGYDLIRGLLLETR